MSAPDLSLGPFRFDPARRILLRDGVEIDLGQRAAALLLALIEAKGAPVSKADLMDRAWAGLAVEEGNLTVQIAQLRKLMGQDEAGRDWIVTVPRVGYRLVATHDVDPAATPRPALAVLPFVSLSSGAEQDYFADGVAEDIITALSKFKSFAVIARNSSFAYRGQAVDVRRVGDELGVRYVLEGSVRRSGERLRISTRLVESLTGHHIWAENFDSAVQDIFDVQDRITECVAALVEPRIVKAEIERVRRKPPGSFDAYDLYLQALPDVYVTRPEANARAIDLLERALVLDPGFAQATAILAQALLLKVVMAFDGSGDADRDRACALARRAIVLIQDDALVVGYAGFALLQLGREYNVGLELLRSAVADNPNNSEILGVAGVGELMAGDLIRSADLLQRALKLCPNWIGAHWQLTGMAHIRIAEHRYEEALDWATRSIGVNAGYDATYWMLIAANAYLGRIEAAHQHLAALQALSPGMTLGKIRRAQSPRDPHRLEVLIEGMRLAGMPE